jgi:tetratricopeptide (TPR) repeat protein
VARLATEERDRLYAETGGNPLLLTWTAGQLGRTTGRCRTIGEAIERLQEAHRLQKLSQKNDPLDFIFGDLVESFTADEIAVLAALVHFTQPARVDWLLPLTKLSVKAAETALDALRDRALLVEDDRAGTWYRPPLAALFLRRTRPKEVGVSSDLLGDWAYAYVVENGYPALERAWPRIVAAFPVLIAGESGRLEKFFHRLGLFLCSSGRWDETLLLASAVETNANTDNDHSSSIKSINVSGCVYFWRGQSADLMDCAARAGRHVEAGVFGAFEQFVSIRLRGFSLELTGSLDAAIDTYDELVSLSRSGLPRSRELSQALGYLADCLRRRREFKKAESCLRQSVSNARKIFDSELLTSGTGKLAQLALDQRQWENGEQLAREALESCKDFDLGGSALQSMRLAEALARQGRGIEGRPHAEYAVATFTNLRSKELAQAQAALGACLG